MSSVMSSVKSLTFENFFQGNWLRDRRLTLKKSIEVKRICQCDWLRDRRLKSKKNTEVKNKKNLSG